MSKLFIILYVQRNTILLGEEGTTDGMESFC
jgi:hypothetical protein